MSTLYLGSELPSLANRLADVLSKHERQSDFFAPVTVVVPNRYLRKWLRLTLARKLGVCANLQFIAFEDALWKLLREVDLRPHPAEPEAIDENTYRLLVLSVLLEDRDPDLGLLQHYIRMQTLPLTRPSCRRAWSLSERLAHLVQEYEYHRQDILIQPWLRGQLGLTHTDDFYRVMERAQRALFTSITRADNGKRRLLSEHGGHDFKTLPQYAMELMEQPLAVRPNQLIHVFGLTQTTELYARVLSWLGQAFDMRVYHLNVLASRAPDRPSAAALRAIAQKYREPANPEHGNELLRLWGRAGAESLGLMAELLASDNYGAEVIEPAPARPLRAGNARARAKKVAPTALSCLHDQLLGRPGARRLAQDRSIQIVACPGIVREVETVYNSILDNLQHNPALRQTDFTVLATDMPQYRPILQAVFERPPKRLRYNLVDYSAAGLSMLGQALLGMLDLALESFTRSRVFAVLLNPCFLARLGIDRAAALAWLEWAETLGVCQGWDAAEKQDQGYPRSHFYAWRLALQRLRLGRYMEVCAEDADEPAPRFGHVIPFADIASADREQLDAFCRAVESLLPRLARLRHQSAGGQRWATDLQRLVQDFLDVPADRAEEEQVRAQVVSAVDRLALWDHLRARSAPSAGLPLALVREYVQTQLEALAGSHGEYLTGGVTLAALQPMRPVPCVVLYVIGLDATLFPGSNALSSFDLRGVRREAGDIRPAEDRTYWLLENLLAAQQKVYLLYNNRDAQKDAPLLPSTPLQQLQRYLGDHVTSQAFEAVALPPCNDDDAYFNCAQQPEHQDVLVQYRDADRFIALNAAADQGRLTLDLHQREELQAKKDTLLVDFVIAPEPRPSVVAPVTISVGELRRFLSFPAEATLRRHLGIEDDEATDALDEEPLVTPDSVARQLVRLSLHQLVRRAAAGDVGAALTDWPERFRALFADAQLRSRVPEDAFGAVDFEALRGELQERIHGKGGLEPFLRGRAEMQSCGPALLGESYVPIGAKMCFPALRLRPGQELPAEADSEIRVVGATPFAWFCKDTFEVLVVTTSKKVDARELCTPMLESLLFYLALLANAEPNARGFAASDWMSRRHFHLHLAHAEGIQTWTYPIGLVSSEEARQYFVQLTRDFLDPAQLDLLPFELIATATELRRAYDESTESVLSAEQYVELLREKLDDERDNPFNRTLRIPPVVNMAGAAIPDDALAKVQRRFRLLDRGPAQCRQGGAGRRG